MKQFALIVGDGCSAKKIASVPWRLPEHSVRVSEQSGQAFSELLVGFVVVGLFMFGANHLWRYGEARQALLSSTRFATWERTVYEPADNAVEKHALHASDTSLARQARIHQLSKPDAWRSVRANAPSGGGVWVATQSQAAAELLPALRTFGDQPDGMLTVSTQSEQQTGWFVGRDPSFNTTTSLELDREALRRVSVTMKSQISQSANWADRVFGFPLPDIDKTQTMTIIANPWAASPPVNRVRTSQLLVLSPGEKASGTAANPLAFFGTNNGGTNIGLGDFVGMVPWWNFVGGANGLGGQYVVRDIGLDAGAANTLIASGGQYGFDASKPVPQNLLLLPQIDSKEYFQPDKTFDSYHKHTNVTDKTTDAGASPPRNSLDKKRKYMAVPLSIYDYYN